MTDITDQDRRDARQWASRIGKGTNVAFDDAKAAARVILATVDAPAPTLAEELRDTARWWREGTPTWEQCCDRFDTLANRAEQIEQERDYLARELAQALADAGLLAPDLPEPTDRSIPEWEMPNNEHHAVSVSRYGTVRIWGDTSGYTPAEAREVAAALLAAAAWAEQQ